MSDEDVDVGRWAGNREASKQRRARNRKASAELLRAAGIHFNVHNKGAHLIVANAYDFWPGTGKWKKRDESTYHRGVHELIARIKAPKL